MSDPGGVPDSNADPVPAPDPRSHPAKRCLSCGLVTRLQDNLGDACIKCHGALQDFADDSDSTERVEYLLSFSRIECEKCGEATAVRVDRMCNHCGAQLPPDVEDANVRARRRVFKSSVQRLVQRASEARVTNPEFTTQGHGIQLEEYRRSVFLPAIDQILAIARSIHQEAGSTRWEGGNEESISAFTRISKSINEGIALVTHLGSILPPLGVRGPHHTLTRAVGNLVAGHLTLLGTVIAADLDEALDVQSEGQVLLTIAADTASALARYSDLALSAPPADWWLSGHTIDFALVAWEGVRRRPGSISDAADAVRSALAGIPGATDLSNADALLLLPATVLPVITVDSVLVRQRAVLVRHLIDDADAQTPGWLVDKQELAEGIAGALRAIGKEISLLASVPKGPEDREAAAHALTSSYRRLLEGPVRTLGAILVIAARATRGDDNANYVRNIALGVQAGEVVQELDRVGDRWRDAAEMLLRNADAHAGVNVLETGIEFTQRKTERGVMVDERTKILSDAEFAEELACLQETVLALQLGIVPWFFTHPDPEVTAARAALTETPQECQAQVALMLGIQGLVDVSITLNDSALAVTARPAAPDVDVRSPLIGGVLPGLFKGWPAADHVTMSIATREAVTFSRLEMNAYQSSSPAESRAALGLINRRWIGNLEQPAAIQADVLWICRPHLIAIQEALQHAVDHGQQPMEIMSAAATLDHLSTRLGQADLSCTRSPMINDVRNLLIDAKRDLSALGKILLRRQTAQVQRRRTACAKISFRLAELIGRTNAVGTGPAVDADD